MWRALAYKEFRETIGFAAIGVVIYFLVAGGAMRMNLLPIPGISIIPVAQGSIPFLDNFTFHFAVASLLLATTIGIRQSWPESNNGGYLFLFHRPVSRGTVINAKLAVGIALFLACGSLPILLLSWWASTPGTHASPFFWSMTTGIWVTWLTMPLVYLGAFLTGLRPANWIGTRLAPLLATVLFVILVNSIPWFTLRLLLTALLSLWLYVNIQSVALNRDYS